MQVVALTPGRGGGQVLVVNPVERFTAGQCLEHEWVRRAGEASAKKLHRRPPPPRPTPPPRP